MEQAKQELARRKDYFPFREWFALEINGEWHYFDSKRKLLAAMRKASIATANVLAAQ